MTHDGSQNAMMTHHQAYGFQCKIQGKHRKPFGNMSVFLSLHPGIGIVCQEMSNYVLQLNFSGGN